MSDDEGIGHAGPHGDESVETFVSHKGDRRRRQMLALILVLLVLLLAVSSYFVVRSSRPVDAPRKADLPAGLTWVRSFYSFGPKAGQALVSPTAVAIGPDGTIWTLANKRVIVGFSPSGRVEKVISPRFGQGRGLVGSLEGIAVGEDGSIYVTDFGNNAVDVFSPTGRLLRSWGVQLPMVLTIRGDRVAVAAANGVALFDTQGRLISKWGSRGKKRDQVDLPHGIAIGRDGNVYVADTQNRRVSAYTPNGRLLWTIADPRGTGEKLTSTPSSAPVVGGVDQSLLLPTGLAQDAAGRLVLVDAFSFEVVVLDPQKQGRIIARYGKEGEKDGQFAYPTGVAYDADRDWLAIADTTNNRVQLIRIAGTGGNVLRRAAKGLSDTPVWMCAIPILFLLIALAFTFAGRRNHRRSYPDSAGRAA